MNEIPEGYFRDNDGMLMQGNVAPQSPPQSPQIDPTALEGLNALDRDQLLSLCRRMACQCGLVAMMTDDETAQAMLDELAHTALKPLKLSVNIKADIQSRMAAIDKWLDRKQGKAIQRVDQRNVNVTLDEATHREAVHKQAVDMMNRLAKVASISGVDVVKTT